MTPKVYFWDNIKHALGTQLRLPQLRRTRSHTDARDCSCTFQTVQNCVDRRIERCGAARLHNSLHHAQRPTVTALRCASQHRIRTRGQRVRGQRVRVCFVAALLCQLAVEAESTCCSASTPHASGLHVCCSSCAPADALLDVASSPKRSACAHPSERFA